MSIRRAQICPSWLASVIPPHITSSAQKTLQDFWGFAKDWVEGLLASGNLAPVEPAASDTLCKPAVELAADEEEEEDRFYDAMDLLDLAALHVSRQEGGRALSQWQHEMTHTGQPPFADHLCLSLQRAQGLRFEDAALLYMRYLCHTGDQQVGVGCTVFFHRAVPAAHMRWEL